MEIALLRAGLNPPVELQAPLWPQTDRRKMGHVLLRVDTFRPIIGGDDPFQPSEPRSIPKRLDPVEGAEAWSGFPGASARACPLHCQTNALIGLSAARALLPRDPENRYLHVQISRHPRECRIRRKTGVVQAAIASVVAAIIRFMTLAGTNMYRVIRAPLLSRRL